MEKETLKKFINQIKKYNLTETFSDIKEFENWLNGLSKKQIDNFNSLNINPNSILFPKHLLINNNLLNCDDYNKRIDLMMNLKIEDGFYHNFDTLCNPKFLNSKHYYKDMEIMSKFSNVRYALWVIAETSFINSKYHDEDLKLILEAKDIDNRSDDLVAECLAEIAADKNSLKSPYHQEDMKLIATCGSKSLQGPHSFPEHGIDRLAANENSLKDKYHLENMQILAKHHNIDNILYELMTDSDIINGKHYRTEIDLVANSKSELTALALYCFIRNPERTCIAHPYEKVYNYLDFKDVHMLEKRNCVSQRHQKDYLNNLQLLSNIDDQFVMYFESLLSNIYFSNSEYKNKDILLLLSVKDCDLFRDLYELMTCQHSLNSIHHTEDVYTIYETENKELRSLLLRKAINKKSLNSEYHRYDMNYILRLDLEKLEEDLLNKMCGYLFYGSFNNKNHKEDLEKLYNNEPIEKTDPVLEQLDNFEKNYTESVPKNKVLSKVKKLFKK